MGKLLPRLFGRLTAIAILTCFGLTAQTNLLVNGSFETGPSQQSIQAGSTAITGWLVIGNNIDYMGTGSGPSWQAADGNRFVDLHGAQWGGVEQVVATVPNSFYTVVFAIAGNPNIPTRTMRLSAASQWQEYSFDATSTSGGQMGWVTRTFVFRATAASATLRFAGVHEQVGDEWGVCLDHVRLYHTPYTTFGAGCAWSGGTPQLDASLPPRIGQPFGLVLTNLPANQPGAVLWGYSNSTWGGNQLPLSMNSLGMTGCTLYTSPDVISLIVTGPFGATIWGEPLPNNPSAVGLQFYNQAFMLAPGANPLGVVMTNAGAGIVGN